MATYIVPPPEPLNTWADNPGYRAMNHGLGCCRLSSGNRCAHGRVCALGGIGCDVDHVEIARAHLIAAGYPRGW